MTIAQVLQCKKSMNRLPNNLYCVGGDVKHCTIRMNRQIKNTSTLCTTHK